MTESEPAAPPVPAAAPAGDQAAASPEPPEDGGPLVVDDFPGTDAAAPGAAADAADVDAGAVGKTGSASEGKTHGDGHSAETGTIVTSKTVKGVAAHYKWSFDFALTPDHGGSRMSKTASGTGPGKDTVTFDGLDTGSTYTLKEDREQDGWSRGDLECGAADTDRHRSGTRLTFPKHSEKIYCTVTNTARSAEVTLTKKVAGAGADHKWSFPFTIEPSPHGEKATKYATSSDHRIHWDGLVPGQRYSITEKTPDGWTAGKVQCRVQGSGHGSHGHEKASEGTSGARFTPDAGDDIKCAVTNTRNKERNGRIVIVKKVDGEDGLFHFTRTRSSGRQGSGSSELGKDFDIETDHGKGRKVFNDVEPGKYTVAEKDSYPDYVAGTPSCTSSEKGKAWKGTSEHGVVIDLDRGETVTCTFENTQTATVIIDKVTDPAKDPTKFDFQWSRDGRVVQEFTLTDRQEPEVFEGLSPYRKWRISEPERSGWNLDDLTCTRDGEDFGGADLRGATAVLDLDPGDVVTCTFTNQKKHSGEGSGGAGPEVPVVDIPEQPETPEIVVDVPEQPEAEINELPETGAQSTNLIWPSAALLLAGTVLVGAARPRRRERRRA
ncbi:prealbumin-like fold domain-containing protein [Arthrobacter sp. SAFR-014]|uniref:prealbumin-like fold domain-containing protein n=1 Tax=unclassified Arthrobacter TaxID=235627 RepID=UPI003F7C1BBB